MPTPASAYHLKSAPAPPSPLPHLRPLSHLFFFRHLFFLHFKGKEFNANKQHPGNACHQLMNDAVIKNHKEKRSLTLPHFCYSVINYGRSFLLKS